MDISVCISTYRRTDQLRTLLADLAQQTELPSEVVVVDNDAEGSAREVIDAALAENSSFPIRYSIQPQKNISLCRNDCIANASAEWLAFIDDDERAPLDWLAGLAATARHFNADGVLAPVIPVLPFDAPTWLQQGQFYSWPRMATGTVVPLNLLRLGNLLLNTDQLRRQPLHFDPAYGLTGGEDGELLSRLVLSGARLVWCDSAPVHEPVQRSRLSLRWLLLRSLRGGQDFARLVLTGHHGPVGGFQKIFLLTRSMTQLVGAVLLALLCLPLGLHRSAYWLTKVSANLGKLSTFLGFHYREYA